MKCASISVHDRTKKSEKVHKMKIHLSKFVSITKSSKNTVKCVRKGDSSKRRNDVETTSMLRFIK